MNIINTFAMIWLIWSFISFFSNTKEDRYKSYIYLAISQVFCAAGMSASYVIEVLKLK